MERIGAATPSLATAEQAASDIAFSASDLNDFLECEHLTQLELAVVRGELHRPQTANPSADLVRRKGAEHEAAHLQFLIDSGRRVVEIEGRPHPARDYGASPPSPIAMGEGSTPAFPIAMGEGRSERPHPPSRDALGRPLPEGEGGPPAFPSGIGEAWWERAAGQTVEAMRAGADVIYQAAFVDGPWRGIADFVERVERPSALGEWSYEVADTKLARHPKPYFLLQLCFYSEMVARLQGTNPESMHVILGTKQRESFRYNEFAAHFRRVRARFESAVESTANTYPYPVDHCAYCEFVRLCERQWLNDDHLSLVYDIRRSQVKRLSEAGIETVQQLGNSNARRIAGIGAPTLGRLQEQAALQSHHRATGEHRYELLEPAEGRGFALLPRPSPGDVFFDMEGDPFWDVDGGLEYLFGAVTVEVTPLPNPPPQGGRGIINYQPFWAHDRVAEGHAFEAFMDFVAERRQRYPDLHVYHYAHYERTALKRLMGQHGTREDALDDLLRNEVLVDLYKVVRQSMRISHPSLSIKKVRTFFMEQTADGGVIDGADSIVAYEAWMEAQDPELLQRIADYNDLDCRSALELRDWLLERRDEAIGRFGDIPWKEPPPPREETDEAAQERSEREELKERLLAGVPEERDERSEEQQARWLLAQLLDYHRREAKPAWWAYFERLEATDEELIDDNEAIAALEAVPGVEPEPVRRSLVYTLAFPPQEHKLGASSQVVDPKTEQGVTVVSIDDASGRLRLSRGAARADQPVPTALIPGPPLRTREQQAAVRRLAQDLLAGGGKYPALRGILFRDFPRLAGQLPGMPIQTLDLKQQTALVERLDGSYLFVQGPPGSGKTWRGANVIVDLLRRGKRVGVAAPSHRAIHNMLDWIEKIAAQERVSFRGLKKSTGGNEESVYTSEHIGSDSDNATFASPDDDVQLFAGTSWLFARSDLEGKLDYLFVDEAGQVALADALAMGTSARNVVLLGDPLQLAQVSQGVHPEGSGGSVLEHLLGESATIPVDQGIFLAETRRMHPDVCDFISEVVYEDRLGSIEECTRQRVDSPGLSGTGIRYFPVEHEGNSQQSPEEADLIAAEVERLLDGGTYVDMDDKTKRLTPDDILVVAPYNAQVRCLRGRVPAGVPVGTVDKFQGGEAPVVFFSMATYSGADLPRNLEFLFSRNRLNVAISRARSLAVLVASPKLLEINCRTVDQMRLVNALCRLVEVAEEQERERAG